MIDKKQLLPLKKRIVDSFTEENWQEIGIITGCDDLINGHHRLLRSLSWQDPDYGGNVLDVLLSMANKNPNAIAEVERYLAERDGKGEIISEVRNDRVVVFSPSVFEIPEESPDPFLLSVMMPFGAGFNGVYATIKEAAEKAGFTCERADNIWDHSTIIQDIFSLIFRSRIVVVDFSGKNPNVFYEAGIAHTLGKIVIPIVQSIDDVPFDLKHHRVAHYLNNDQGRTELGKILQRKLEAIKGKPKPEAPKTDAPF